MKILWCDAVLQVQASRYLLKILQVAEALVHQGLLELLISKLWNQFKYSTTYEKTKVWFIYEYLRKQKLQGFQNNAHD